LSADKEASVDDVASEELLGLERFDGTDAEVEEDADTAAAMENGEVDETP